jgi:hypothetical protein
VKKRPRKGSDREVLRLADRDLLPALASGLPEVVREMREIISSRDKRHREALRELFEPL